MGAVSSTTWTVSDVDDSNLAAGSVGNSPWSPSATTYDTGEWQTFSIDTSSLTGLTGVVTFSAVDSATGGQVSGFILDDVTHVPEPGTFLLFGLGFVGMALYGRRKMKKQK